jgi:peptide deformylase
MAIKEIRTVPDPVLRKKAIRVKTVDTATKKLIKDMHDTLTEAQGVGLAAPQVGVSSRIIVIHIPVKDQPVEKYCLINPEIVKTKGERVVKEGCLSIPGWWGEIKRCEQVKVKGLDKSGKEQKITATGLLAQALEHEIDHLNGVLFVDHVESQDKLQKLEPETEEIDEPNQTPVRDTVKQ